MKFASLFLASAWAKDKSINSNDRTPRPSSAIGWGLPDITSGCPATEVSGPGWTVESDHYYSNYETCRRSYTCPDNTVMFYKWNRIDLEYQSTCYYDFVRLSGKDQQTGAVTSAYHCGSKSSGSHPALFDWQMFNGQEAIVEFYTDYSVTRWGFSLDLKCVDQSTIDMCTFTNCHQDATCSVDESGAAVCTCRFLYSGDGVNTCAFDLGKVFQINTYRVTSNISDRYVQNEVAVVVENRNPEAGEFYTFDVNLDEYEFISSLVLRVGDNGPVTKGSVHLEQTAQEIFDNAVSNGLGAAITQEEYETEVSDTSFATTVFVPAGEKLYVWLNYDMQLQRTERNYKYRTHIAPSDPIDSLEIVVNIDESRPIKMGQTYSWFGDEDKQTSNTFNKRTISNSHVQFTYTQTDVARDGFDNQLRVEYDVDRPSAACGDIIMRDGYFVHFISPESVDPMPKNVVLTIDTSGSMSIANRMAKARNSVISFLNQLDPEDTFWLQEFNSYTSFYMPEAQLASPGNIANAIRWVRSLNAGGGTALASATLNSVNRPLDAERANIAFVISDGEPTSGETRWNVIQANTLAANVRPDGHGQKWAVFNIGIGNGAPINEITKLSIQNQGVAVQIFDNENVEGILGNFFEEYAMPIIWNQKFEYTGVDQFDCSCKLTSQISESLKSFQPTTCSLTKRWFASVNSLTHAAMLLLVLDLVCLCLRLSKTFS